MLVPLRQNLYPHYVGGFFDFPDRPPQRKTKIKEVIEEVAEKVIENRIDTGEQELALRLKFIQREIQWRNLYLKWLEKEVKRRKRNRKIALVLTLLNI